MRSKFFFILIVLFWLVMNYLLWRSQSAASRIGSAIPVQVVWDKILTAPDDSPLDIYDHEKKIGHIEWHVKVGNVTQAMNRTLTEDYEPDGLVPQPSGYELDFGGNVSIFNTNHATFKMFLLLSTNESWQDFRFSCKMRPPIAWDIHAIDASKKIMVKFTGEDDTWQRTLKFSDFEHPESLLAEIGGLDALGVAGAVAAPMEKASIAQAAAGLPWEAHEDWMQFGHSKVHVYRLETQFLGQHLYIFASRVGEILWVEAPNKLTLRNGLFNHF